MIQGPGMVFNDGHSSMKLGEGCWGMSLPPWTCRFGIGSFLEACSSGQLMAS